eukprot:353263-Chlamydomonas_euryale.AAC.1
MDCGTAARALCEGRVMDCGTAARALCEGRMRERACAHVPCASTRPARNGMHPPRQVWYSPAP